MPLEYLAQMRPLFLAAVVLCLSATGFAINVRFPDTYYMPSLLLLGLATFALAVVSIRAQRAAWAQALALRPEASLEEVRPCLFAIGFLSFLFSAWAFLIVWESVA
jgi:hypothetical protein